MGKDMTLTVIRLPSTVHLMDGDRFVVAMRLADLVAMVGKVETGDRVRISATIVERIEVINRQASGESQQEASP